MRKSILVFAAFTAAFVCACTREEVQVPKTVEYKEITLSARSNDAVTKSSRDENGTFYWSQEDRISLFRGTVSDGGWEFISTNTESATSADFKGKVPVEVLEDPTLGDYWAVYPYNEANSFIFGENTLTTVVPAEQVAAEGTFADGQFISIGRCPADEGNLAMTFYHLCGGIKFTVQKPYKSITLRGNNNEVLAGTVDVVLDGKSPVVIDVREPRTKITIACPDGASFKPGVEYFIVTLPVKFENGFTVSFDDSSEREVDTPLTINRAKFQWSKYPLDFTGEFIYETCTIENEGVWRFIQQVDYSEDISYTYSDVDIFYRQFHASDTPLPVSFTWEGDASEVVISIDKDFEEVYLTLDVSRSSSSSVDVYNLIPGVSYYYKVMNDKGMAIKLACMTPEGPVRMINGVTRNMRDLGGWDTGTIATENGPVSTSIKYGKIYRGYNINDITEEGKRILLEDLGVTMEIDLRGYELQNNNRLDQPRDVLNGQAQYVNLSPVMFMFDQRTNQSGVTEGLYRQALHIIIEELSRGGVVFFHCIGGADRTGTLAFLIEALLGVSESNMSKEYEMTTFYGSLRRRNIDMTNINDANNRNCPYPFKELIKYLRGGSIYNDQDMQSLVEDWAMRGEYALSEQEISTLRELLIETKDGPVLP